jgi:hypothetical protein
MVFKLKKYIHFFTNQATYEEVKCTEPSPLVRLPCPRWPGPRLVLTP